MRVLFCSSEFWPARGGRGIFAAQLLPALQEYGHDLHVITLILGPAEATRDSFRSIPVYRMPCADSLQQLPIDRWLALRSWMTDLKREVAPDLIHLHGFDPWLTLFHTETAKTQGTPWILTLTEDLPPMALRSELFKRALLTASWVTAKSRSALNQARSIAPQIEFRSSIIHNGLVIPELAPAPLPHGQLLVLSRLVREKGIDLVLDALPTVIARFPHARLVVAGAGPEKQELEQQAARLDIAKFVDFVGWVAHEKIPELINAAGLVVIPSRRDGLPNVALQASAVARPIVATRIAGISDAVHNGLTGVLVAPESSGALADAICLLLHQPEMAARLGDAGRRGVQEDFGWDRCVRAYDHLYRRIRTTAARTLP